MGLKKCISKFFPKKNKNITSSALACMRNIVGIPKREDYTNDKEAEELIDNYKNK